MSLEVLEDEIASKANLVVRVYMNTTICCLCGEEEEITSHLFCTYKIVWFVWAKCYKWIGMTTMFHREPKKHFEGFRLIGVKESVNQIWGGVWIAVVGEL